MQRKKVQLKRRPTSRPTSKKTVKKGPVPFSEMVLNSVIILLAVVVLVFFLSMVYRIFSKSKPESTEEITPIEQQETVQEIIRIEVLNGCGVRGVAATFTDYLRTQGFDVVNTDNYRNFDVDSSFVIDRRSMRKVNGIKLAKSLGISMHRVEPVLSEDMAIEATLVLGKDYKFLTGYSESGTEED